MGPTDDTAETRVLDDDDDADGDGGGGRPALARSLQFNLPFCLLLDLNVMNSEPPPAAKCASIQRTSFTSS